MSKLKEKLDTAYERAIETARKVAVGPREEFYPLSISGKQIAKAEPAVRRHITDIFRKHFKKTGGDEIAAWNATLEEISPIKGDIGTMPMPAFLKRHVVGAVVRHVSRGVARRAAKREGKTETWKVTSIEAWREPEGGWTWNQSFRAGTIELPPHASTREMLKRMREDGYLGSKSMGHIRVEKIGGDPYLIEFQDKNTGEPFFAIEPVEEE